MAIGDADLTRERKPYYDWTLLQRLQHALGQGVEGVTGIGAQDFGPQRPTPGAEQPSARRVGVPQREAERPQAPANINRPRAEGPKAPANVNRPRTEGPGLDFSMVPTGIRRESVLPPSDFSLIPPDLLPQVLPPVAPRAAPDRGKEDVAGVQGMIPRAAPTQEAARALGPIGNLARPSLYTYDTQRSPYDEIMGPGFNRYRDPVYGLKGGPGGTHYEVVTPGHPDMGEDNPRWHEGTPAWQAQQLQFAAQGQLPGRDSAASRLQAIAAMGRMQALPGSELEARLKEYDAPPPGGVPQGVGVPGGGPAGGGVSRVGIPAGGTAAGGGGGGAGLPPGPGGMAMGAGAPGGEGIGIRTIRGGGGGGGGMGGGGIGPGGGGMDPLMAMAMQPPARVLTLDAAGNPAAYDESDLTRWKIGIMEMMGRHKDAEILRGQLGVEQMKAQAAMLTAREMGAEREYKMSPERLREERLTLESKADPDFWKKHPDIATKEGLAGILNPEERAVGAAGMPGGTTLTLHQAPKVPLPIEDLDQTTYGPMIRRGVKNLRHGLPPDAGWWEEYWNTIDPKMAEVDRIAKGMIDMDQATKLAWRRRYEELKAKGLLED